MSRFTGSEHSLEFQALWLKYLWRDKAPPWVPVLCSSFDAFCDDRPPSAIPAVEDAIRKMEAAVAAAVRAGRHITVLVGVDLAHVGPRFGDEVELNDELCKKIEAADRVSMEKALALDADGFYMATIEGGHWRKVCGLSALYTGLRLMKAAGASTGKLLAYGQAPDPMGGVVSFPGAIFPAGSSEERRPLSV